MMSQDKTALLLATAIQHHRAGALQQATLIYWQILAGNPHHAGALHLLGVASHQVGQHQAALDLLRRSIALRPDSADALSDLGLVLIAIGDVHAAIESFDRSLTLRPNSAPVLFNLGNALFRKGDVDRAIALFEQSNALMPGSAEICGNLGAAFAQKGHSGKAVVWYRQAARQRPDLFETHYNLATALKDHGELDEAIAGFRQALTLRPGSPEAYNNLGNALKDKGQLDEAIASYRQAIALKSSDAIVHYNLGCTLAANSRFDEAIESFQRALVLKPDYPEAQNNYGNALKSIGRLDEAVECYRRAAGLHPGIDAAARDAATRRPIAPVAHSNLIYAMLYHPTLDRQSVFRECRRWNDLHAAPLAAEHVPHIVDRSPDRRLRIGYVSADFRRNSISLFIKSLLACHDPAKFEIHCFSSVTSPDDFTAWCRQTAHRWHDCARSSDMHLAELIRREQIDILVDLALHTASNRLVTFARRPAPVQVTWLGYPGTTGLDAIDYRISDPHMDPPGLNDDCYSEKTLLLPDSFWCYDPLSPAKGDDARIGSNGITFGCLNTFWKINPPLLRLWSAVLRAVKDSELLMLAPEGSARTWVLGIMNEEGIHPGRVRFQPRMQRADYLRSYRQIDVALDTFPYNGHTTSLDAMWMGVPVVTLAGESAVSRAGLSHLNNIGLPDLVATTPGQFTRVAAQLAHDAARRTELRRTLRARLEHSTLMDSQRFARNIEHAYRTMWAAWCAAS